MMPRLPRTSRFTNIAQVKSPYSRIYVSCSGAKHVKIQSILQYLQLGSPSFIP